MCGWVDTEKGRSSYHQQLQVGRWRLEDLAAIVRQLLNKVPKTSHPFKCQFDSWKNGDPGEVPYFYGEFFSPFPGFFFSRLSSRRLVCQGSKAASKQASKEGSQRASKPASQQASKGASEQASKQASKPASKQASQAASQATSNCTTVPLYHWKYCCRGGSVVMVGARIPRMGKWYV